MHIAAVKSAFPPHYYSQKTILEALQKRWAGNGNGSGFAVVERLHRNVQVEGRYLAIPIEDFDNLSSWGQANDAWIRVASDVGQEALQGALDAAGLAAEQVDAIIFSSITGIAPPSMDARLANRVGLPPQVKRMPLFGLGCVFNIVVSRWKGARFAADKGVPIAAGFIVGDAVVGVINAVLKVTVSTL